MSSEKTASSADMVSECHFSNVGFIDDYEKNAASHNSPSQACPGPSISRTSLLDILSYARYPEICREILSNLNLYDLLSLRKSCRTLRSELPVASKRLLGGRCHAYGDKCSARNALSNEPLHQCSSYTELGGGGARHTTPFWVCRACVAGGVEELGHYPFKEDTDHLQPPLKEALIPICRGCWETTKKEEECAKSKLPQSTRDKEICVRFDDDEALRERLLEKWCCPYCTQKWFGLVAIKKARSAVLEYTSLLEKRGLSQRDLQERFICGKCDKLHELADGNTIHGILQYCVRWMQRNFTLRSSKWISRNSETAGSLGKAS